ncbi:MAG: hypothetical protein ACJ0UT_11575 [Candidatus Latescibacterota bacterium]|jgi:hypothetical protein
MYGNLINGDQYAHKNQTLGDNPAVSDDLPHFFSPRKAQQVATATFHRGLPGLYKLYNELGLARQHLETPSAAITTANKPTGCSIGVKPPSPCREAARVQY